MFHSYLHGLYVYVNISIHVKILIFCLMCVGVLPACTCVYYLVCSALRGQKKMSEPWDWIIDCHELIYGCRDLNSGPLEGQAAQSLNF